MQLEHQSPMAAHWSEGQYENLFLKASDSDIDRQSNRRAWVVEDAATLLAFLVANQIGSEWELENIVVAETARRAGVGTRLLGEFMAHVRAAEGNEIFLEVRQSNQAARLLYQKLGFEEAGLRRSYYSGPPEDAILCRLRLC